MPKEAKSAKKTVKTVKKGAPTSPEVLRDYELTVVVSPVVKSEQRADVLLSLKTLIEDSKGKIEKTDEWGLKDLAYPILHQKSGWYVSCILKLPAQAVAKLQESVGREKTLLRYLLIAL